MSNLEIIDRLCAVTQAQSDIIREQATFIEEQLTVDAEIKKQFSDKRKAVDDELDLLEYGLRTLLPEQTPNSGKGGNQCGEQSEPL